MHGFSTRARSKNNRDTACYTNWRRGWQIGAGNWRTGLHDDFNPDTSYFGYFEGKQLDGTSTKYSYDVVNGFFYEDTTGDWDGNFLNWLTMRRIDVVRKVLVGGKVRDRAGESLGERLRRELQQSAAG